MHKSKAIWCLFRSCPTNYL